LLEEPLFDAELEEPERPELELLDDPERPEYELFDEPERPLL
jgi:hypothetical protein